MGRIEPRTSVLENRATRWEAGDEPASMDMARRDRRSAPAALHHSHQHTAAAALAPPRETDVRSSTHGSSSMAPRDPSPINPYSLLDLVKAAAWAPPNLPLFPGGSGAGCAPGDLRARGRCTSVVAASARESARCRHAFTKFSCAAVSGRHSRKPVDVERVKDTGRPCGYGSVHRRGRSEPIPGLLC
jgi:hypothetical protein